MIFLEAKSVTKSYADGDRNNVVLKDISLGVERGDFCIITGPSGSGKSTLLHLLSGLDDATTGEVIFNGKNLSKMSPKEIASLRNECFGFVFQSPHLLTDKTVFENIALPFFYSTQNNNAFIHARVSELLEYVGLKGFEERFSNTLSGGEMQRVVFARALVLNPEIIFADEPTGSLDEENSVKILELLKKESENQRVIVMVTHSSTALPYASSLLHLEKR